jgi:hypothetical protein
MKEPATFHAIYEPLKGPKMTRLLFLDDDQGRHAIFARRAKKLLANRSHQVWQTSSPVKAIEIARREGMAGQPLDAIFLDRDLGQSQTGESVARALIDFPTRLRPRRVVVHSRNFFRAPVMVRELRKAGYKVIRAPFK